MLTRRSTGTGNGARAALRHACNAILQENVIADMMGARLKTRY